MLSFTFVDKNCLIPIVKKFNVSSDAIHYLMNYTYGKNNNICKNIYVVVSEHLCEFQFETNTLYKYVYVCKEDFLFKLNVNNSLNDYSKDISVNTNKNIIAMIDKLFETGNNKNYVKNNNLQNNVKKNSNLQNNNLQNSNLQQNTINLNKQYANDFKQLHNIQNETSNKISDKILVETSNESTDDLTNNIINNTTNVVDTNVVNGSELDTINIDKIEKEQLEKIIQELKDKLTNEKSEIKTIMNDIKSVNKREETKIFEYNIEKIKNIGIVKNDYKVYLQITDDINTYKENYNFPVLYKNIYRYITYLLKNEENQKMLELIKDCDIDKMYVTNIFNIDENIYNFVKSYVIKTKENHYNFDHEWTNIEEDDVVKNIKMLDMHRKNKQ